MFVGCFFVLCVLGFAQDVSADYRLSTAGSILEPTSGMVAKVGLLGDLQLSVSDALPIKMAGAMGGDAARQQLQKQKPGLGGPIAMTIIGGVLLLGGGALLVPGIILLTSNTIAALGGVLLSIVGGVVVIVGTILLIIGAVKWGNRAKQRKEIQRQIDALGRRDRFEPNFADSRGPAHAMGVPTLSLLRW